MRLRLIAVVFLTPLVAAAALFVTRQSVSSTPPPVKAKPQGIVWANRVFSEPQPFAQWLRARNYSYDKWARWHPRAAVLLAQ